VAGDTDGFDDVFVHGASLTLEASPEFASAGDTLTFNAWTGQPAGATLLVAVDVNAVPLFTVLFVGNFDASGVWTVGATVPAGLAGNVVTFEEVGFTPNGKVGASNREVVTFQ
jgi:hypothetical protein